MEFKIPSEKLVRTYGRGELFRSKLEGFYSELWLVEIVTVFRLAIGPFVFLVCRSLFHNIKSAHY
jgi:hypothetical protein